VVGQTKILVGQRMVIIDESIGISQLFGGTCPGCPPKSMPVRSEVDAPEQKQLRASHCSEKSHNSVFVRCHDDRSHFSVRGKTAQLLSGFTEFQNAQGLVS